MRPFTYWVVSILMEKIYESFINGDFDFQLTLGTHLIFWLVCCSCMYLCTNPKWATISYNFTNSKNISTLKFTEWISFLQWFTPRELSQLFQFSDFVV